MPGGERLMLGLFVVSGAALALSPSKLPVFAVSITGPLFGWIFLEAATKRSLRWPTRWIALASLFWFALFCSLAGNVVLGDMGAVGREEIALLVRYGFWLAVFVVTAALTARARWTPRLFAWLTASAAALVLVRVLNASDGGEPWLHQNEYGFRFSVFVPFLAAACLIRGGLLPAAGLALAAAAVLLNGSRSSWIALAVAGLALLAMRAMAGRSIRGPVLVLTLTPALLAGCAAVAPVEWRRQVAERWASFDELDTDKPFQTRLALVEKGVSLFERRPLFGAGLGRFDQERVRLAGAHTPWTNDEELNHRSSHNAYLSLLAETGLVGVAAFAVLLAALLVSGARSAYRLTCRGEDWAGGVWASALATSIHLTTLSGLTGTLPWFVFGLTAGMIERDRRGALR